MDNNKLEGRPAGHLKSFHQMPEFTCFVLKLVNLGITMDWFSSQQETT